MISVRRRSQRSIRDSAQRADEAERQQSDREDPRDSTGRRAASDVENDQLRKGDLGQTIAELAQRLPTHQGAEGPPDERRRRPPARPEHGHGLEAVVRG